MVRLSIAIFAAGLVSFQARAECLLKPDLGNRAGHWRYHTDQATHQKCWYLSTTPTTPAQTAETQAAGAQPAGAPATPAIEAPAATAADADEAGQARRPDAGSAESEPRAAAPRVLASAPRPVRSVVIYPVNDPWTVAGVTQMPPGDRTRIILRQPAEQEPVVQQATPESTRPAAPAPDAPAETQTSATAPMTTTSSPGRTQSEQAPVESMAEEAGADTAGRGPVDPQGAETNAPVQVLSAAPEEPQSKPRAPRNFARWLATVAGASLAVGIAVLWCLQPLRERKRRSLMRERFESTDALAEEDLAAGDAEPVIAPFPAARATTLEGPADSAPAVAKRLLTTPEAPQPERVRAPVRVAEDDPDLRARADARLMELLHAVEARMTHIGNAEPPAFLRNHNEATRLRRAQPG